MAVYKREYASRKTRKAVWAYQFQSEGRTYKKSGFETQTSAQEAENRKRHKLRFSRRHAVPVERVSFEQFVPRFFEQRSLAKAEGTVVRERRRMTPLLAFFGKKRLTGITVRDIHDYVADRKKRCGVANRTVNLELTLLRSIFRSAIDNGVASDNPAKAVTNLREVHDERQIPTETELMRFVQEAEKTLSAAVLVPWIWFRVYTGTRPAESLFVEWRDIDFEHGQIHIRPKTGYELKNRRFRVVEMHADLREILLRWRMQWEQIFARRHRRYPTEPSPPHDWLFFNPQDQVERADGFYRCFDKARKAAGLPWLTPHTLRHYFLSRCVMGG